MNRRAYFFIFIFLATLALCGAAYFLAGQKLDYNFATALEGLFIGFGVIVTLATLRQMKEANYLSLIAAIHARFNDSPSYECRCYIFNQFDQHLADVTEKIFGPSSVTSGRVNIEWFINNLDEDPTKEKELNEELMNIASGVNTLSALTAVEHVLLDFDLIAVPFCDGNATAHTAAHSFEPLLRQTSELILPFIAIKMKLRGPKSYKYHYLKLLKDLGIDLKKVPVPARP
jgi:hypothetical protein